MALETLLRRSEHGNSLETVLDHSEHSYNVRNASEQGYRCSCCSTNQIGQCECVFACQFVRHSACSLCKLMHYSTLDQKPKTSCYFSIADIYTRAINWEEILEEINCKSFCSSSSNTEHWKTPAWNENGGLLSCCWLS